MNPHQLLLANAVRTVVFLVVVGLIVRRRAHLCWSFMGYLSVIVICNSLMSLLPDYFYNQSFWIMKETLYSNLKLAVAAEIAYRVFRAFPGALSRARLVLAPLVGLTGLVMLSVPPGADYVDILTRYNPQVQAGVIWILAATSVLAVWYNLPLNRLHRAILLGFTSYLIVFATLYNILRSFGFNRLRDTVGFVDGYAYLALVTWWAFTAWRGDESFETAPMRVPKLAPRTA